MRCFAQWWELVGAKPSSAMTAPTAMPSARFTVGDTVELRGAPFDTVGTVVAVLREDQVKVEWNTGQGLLGKTTMVSERALRKRLED